LIQSLDFSFTPERDSCDSLKKQVPQIDFLEK